MGLTSVLRGVAIGAALLVPLAVASAETPVPAPGVSPKIDQIKERGTLLVAAIGEFPWLPENTTGSGPQFSGPAWLLAEEYAKRLGVELEVVPVSHETKVPILAAGGADITIAPLSVTPQRQEVVDFVTYSQSSLCLFGKADNPKIKDLTSVDDLNSEDITIAFFTGTPPENWAPTRFPKAQLHGVAGSGANAPVEEIMAGRADVAPIDYAAWPTLAKQVPGLIVFPPGDACLQSQEMKTDVGLAVDKADPAFYAWLQAVYDDIEDQVKAEELRILKN
ncbi:MAG: transporter substrate-binding domain-containing protein [Bauldia sp.]|nr:transporter substrate-binding domain-containing protein [Bauldia sp.]